MKLLLFVMSICVVPTAFAQTQTNDFPTQARVEYVIGCMNKLGGQNYNALYRCVCGIDAMATQFSYEEYTEAATFFMLRRTPGERGGVFRDPPRAQELIKKFKKVNSHAEATCNPQVTQ